MTATIYGFIFVILNISGIFIKILPIFIKIKSNYNAMLIDIACITV